MADLKQEQSLTMKPKSLYTIFRFDKGPNRYSLIKITDVNFSHAAQKQPPNPTSILQMPCSEFPTDMGFIALGSKLYCIGGQSGPKPYHSKKVYVVDLNTIETCSKENRSPFVEVADMHEGKRFPYVFASNGKIYVLDGCRNFNSADYKSNSFEVFDPEKGEWNVLPRHTFYNTKASSNRYSNTKASIIISGHAQVGDRVFFWSNSSDNPFSYHSYDAKFFSFDLKTKNWVNYQDEEIDYDKIIIIEDDSYYDRERNDIELVGDYISAWSKTLKEDGLYLGNAITVNNTLYAYKDGSIATYHISNNEDDRSIPSETVRGIDFSHVDQAELVHVGDEKFCLVIITSDYGPGRDRKKELVFVTFQVVKQNSSKPDEFLCWADIKDFHGVKSFDSFLSDDEGNGNVLYAFAA